jgi:hypothetical protein
VSCAAETAKISTAGLQTPFGANKGHIATHVTFDFIDGIVNADFV